MVHFKWIALSLVVPSPKHYNTSASDLHLSGAPTWAGAGQGTLVVVFSTKTECVPRTAKRSDNCRLNVQLTLIETIVCARVHAWVCAIQFLILPVLFHKSDYSLLSTCACCILLYMFLRMCIIHFVHAPAKKCEMYKSAELVQMLMKHVKSPA